MDHEKAYCPGCGTENLLSDKFCGRCWGPLQTGVLYTKEQARKKIERLNRARIQRRIIKTILSFGAVLAILLFYTQPYWLDRIPPPTSSLTPDSGLEDWVMQGRDTSNSANASQFENINGDLIWQFDTKKPFLSSPSIADGVVFVTTGDARIVALKSEDGELLWEQNVSGPVNASPLVLEDSLYIGLRDGRILRLSQKNGGIIWSFQTDNPVISSVIAFDGILYAGSADGNVYALDVVTGKKIWSFDTEDWITTTPAIINDKLVVGNRAGNVFVLDLKTGKKSLRYHSGKVSDSILAGDDHVFIPTSCTHSVSRGCAGGIRALDPSKREYPLEYFARFWRTHFYIWGIEDSPPVQKGFLWGTALVGRSKAMFSPSYADGIIYAYGGHGNLVAMDAASGEISWTYSSGKSAYSSPAISKDKIYIGTNDGEIHIIDMKTGLQHLVLATGGSITGQLVLAGGRLYAASRDGSLYVFE
ncbi:hypothetical protein FIM02_01875 [SAR202 cluster bacterium AD-802-E10_MRT_200m]|nr:hypothetical protein [SAR202 cluster bacterium AD-802-E10_MRT_200m]